MTIGERINAIQERADAVDVPRLCRALLRSIDALRECAKRIEEPWLVEAAMEINVILDGKDEI